MNLEANLNEWGIYTSEQLLASAQTPDARKALAAQVGTDTRTILELANRADLARVRGIAGVFSDLLEHAGVDTVKELGTRNPDNLHAKLAEVNAREKLAGRIPSLNMVKDWVAQAAEMPKMLEY
jgi:predicted flap endonuclease-1-like 5' DNA nuclease